MKLAENVLHFARILRAAGISIGSDKVMDAVRMLPAAGLERRGDCHATLSALFLTRHDQQPLFDEAFARFWRDPALAEHAASLQLPEVRGPLAKPATNPGRVSEAFIPPASRLSPPASADHEITLDATLTFSSMERLKAIDFERMTTEEWNEAKRLVSSLRLPFPSVRTRRHRPDPRGASFDLARTLRRMAREGGDLPRIARRARIERPPPLVVLCDISGSMHRYTRMFLHFVHALARDRGRVSTFVFGTRLTNVTRPLRDRDVDDALAKVSAAVPDWDGGTRIGECLREFNFRWSRRVLAQNAAVILVSDGLDRDDAPTLAAEMARLHRAARSLVWLNPLLRFDGFEPRASGIAAMLPHADLFLPMHNLASLGDLARRLSHGAPGTTPTLH
ncbi:MAG: vWA domain-containing protein [Bacillota bacterium]